MPPSLADWVPENHLARFVSDVVAKAALKAEARALAEGKDPAQSVPPPKAQRNFTDPESKIQQTSDGFIQAITLAALGLGLAHAEREIREPDHLVGT